MRNAISKSKVHCCVAGCNTLARWERDVSFHHFPQADLNWVEVKNEHGQIVFYDRLELWKRNLKIEKEISKSMRVCSLHFKDSDYIPNYKKTRRGDLKKIAYPTQNLPTTSHTALIEPKSGTSNTTIVGTSRNNSLTPVKQEFMEDTDIYQPLYSEIHCKIEDAAEEIESTQEEIIVYNSTIKPEIIDEIESTSMLDPSDFGHQFNLDDTANKIQPAQDKIMDYNSTIKQEVIDVSEDIKPEVIDEIEGTSVLDPSDYGHQFNLDDTANEIQSSQDKIMDYNSTIKQEVIDDSEDIKSEVIDEIEGTSVLDPSDYGHQINLDDTANKIQPAQDKIMDYNSTIKQEVIDNSEDTVMLHQLDCKNHFNIEYIQDETNGIKKEFHPIQITDDNHMVHNEFEDTNLLHGLVSESTLQQIELTQDTNAVKEFHPIKQEGIKIIHNKITNMFNDSENIINSQEIKSSEDETDFPIGAENEYIPIKPELVDNIHMVCNKDNKTLLSLINKSDSELKQINSIQDEMNLLSDVEKEFKPEMVDDIDIVYNGVTGSSDITEQIKSLQNEIILLSSTKDSNSSTNDNDSPITKSKSHQVIYELKPLIDNADAEMVEDIIYNEVTDTHTSGPSDIREEIKSSQNEINLISSTEDSNSSRNESRVIKSKSHQVIVELKTLIDKADAEMVQDIIYNEVTDTHTSGPSDIKEQIKSSQNEINLTSSTEDSNSSTNGSQVIKSNSQQVIYELKTLIDNADDEMVQDIVYNEVTDTHTSGPSDIREQIKSQQNEINMISSTEDSNSSTNGSRVIKSNSQQVIYELKTLIDNADAEMVQDIVYNEVTDTHTSGPSDIREQIKSSQNEINLISSTEDSNSSTNGSYVIKSNSHQVIYELKTLIDKADAEIEGIEIKNALIKQGIINEHSYCVQLHETKGLYISCNVCGVPFETYRSLNEHNRKWTCTICNTSFQSWCEYAYHEVKCYHCINCKQHFNQIYDYQAHTNSKKPSKCTECDALCKNICLLQKHKVDNHAAQKCTYCHELYDTNDDDDNYHSKTCITCENCCKTFSSQCLLKIHHNYCIKCKHCNSILKHLKLRNKHAAIKLKNKYLCCNQSFSSLCQLNKHMNKLDCKRSELLSQVEYTCSICKKQFKTVQKLKAHSMEHISNQCDTCKKRFYTIHQMDNHRKNSSCSPNHRKYICPICSARYISLYDLEKHKAAHFTRCAFCGIRFKSNRALIIHRKTSHKKLNLRMKLLNCKICNQNFPTATSWQMHNKSHLRKFKCTVCMRGFVRKKSLDNHMYTHSSINYTCNKCNEDFNTPHKLELHYHICTQKIIVN